MASKGSVAVDGVSLTLVDVDDDRFSVALIPHTLAATTLGQRRTGDEVNLETDVLAKYVERQLLGECEMYDVRLMMSVDKRARVHGNRRRSSDILNLTSHISHSP